MMWSTASVAASASRAARQLRPVAATNTSPAARARARTAAVEGDTRSLLPSSVPSRSKATSRTAIEAGNPMAPADPRRPLGRGTSRRSRRAPRRLHREVVEERVDDLVGLAADAHGGHREHRTGVVVEAEEVGQQVRRPQAVDRRLVAGRVAGAALADADQLAALDREL